MSCFSLGDAHRFRMINWRYLFGNPRSSSDEDNGMAEWSSEKKRAALMEKLLAANKGLAKLTGRSPETMEDMLSDLQMQESIQGELDTKPKVVGAETTDKELIVGDDLLNIPAVVDMNEKISSGQFVGVEELPLPTSSSNAGGIFPGFDGRSPGTNSASDTGTATGTGGGGGGGGEEE